MDQNRTPADTPEGHNQKIDILYRKSPSIDDPKARYPGFKPGSTILAKGSVHRKGALALPCDIVFERDVAVPMRDETVIYIDVFRPVGAENVPAIMGWSPYGKKGGYQHLDQLPGRFGIPVGLLSNLQAWEGPDPAYWCNQGYAVVNPDARGAFMSEGDIAFWGKQEAEDGHDLIEWLATQEWSNGKVGLTGNSWLAIIQWFIAATQPPHLAAIAPWEGLTDLYRQDVARGGIAHAGFNNDILSHLYGNNRTEDIPAMLDAYPLMNAYWKDKAAALEKIEVPAYVVASYTNPLHVPGTFEGFRRISSARKWLRIHNTMEWPDYYNPANVEDLRKFFDHYLKGMENGWETTPKVRLSVLDLGGTDVVNRVETEFPPNQCRYSKLYLDAETETLSPNPASREAMKSYKGDDGKSKAIFTTRFEKETELVGHMNLHLWVEGRDTDDMDLFVLVQKLNRRGKPLSRMVVALPNPIMRYGLKILNALGIVKFGALFYAGPNGRLRVSHRQLDKERSTPSIPYHTHTQKDLLEPGQIVSVQIPLYPIGMKFHAGEQLRLTIAGYDLIGPLLPGIPLPPMRNRGVHVIHTGGKYDSHLLVPMNVN
jgi:predicted acyl esterase